MTSQAWSQTKELEVSGYQWPAPRQIWKPRTTSGDRGCQPNMPPRNAWFCRRTFGRTLIPPSVMDQTRSAQAVLKARASQDLTQTHFWVQVGLLLLPLELWLPKDDLLSLRELTSPFWPLLPAPPLHSALALLASWLFQNIPGVPTSQPFVLVAALPRDSSTTRLSLLPWLYLKVLSSARRASSGRVHSHPACFPMSPQRPPHARDFRPFTWWSCVLFLSPKSTGAPSE